ADANLPLMYWYALEPLVPTNPPKALELAASAEIPLVRQFVARRVTDDAVTKGDKGDLSPLVAAMGTATEKVRTDLLKGAREGIRGRKKMTMPAGWPGVYAKLKTSTDATVRESAIVLALVFGDPQALADLRAVTRNADARPAERVAALEALVDNR